MGDKILDYDYLGKTQIVIEKNGNVVSFIYETRDLDTGDNVRKGGVFTLENYKKGIDMLAKTGHCEIEGFHPKTSVNWGDIPKDPPKMIIDARGGTMDITIYGTRSNDITLCGYHFAPSQLKIKE